MSVEVRVLLGLAVLISGTVGLGQATQASFHLLRLTIPLLFVLLPALAWALFSPGVLNTRVRVMLRSANLVMLLTTAVLFHAMGPVNTDGPPDMVEPDLAGYDREAGRIALVNE